MTLNASGTISLAGTTTGQSVEIELGGSGTSQISLNDTNVRTLLGVASGQISMSSAYGKSNRVSLSYTFTSSTPNASLNVTSIGGYVSGKSDITITVNGGVYLYATSTGNYGLTLSGGNTGDTVTLVNKGYIMGMGGAGARCSSNGATGGPALSIGFNTTINNANSAAYIGGGGGGGSGGNYGGGLGAGGGGGAGGGSGGPGAVIFVGCATGGAGGAIGAGGGTGGIYTYHCPCGGGYAIGGGGGGGRVFPGSGGAGGCGCSGYDQGRGGTAGGGGGGETQCGAGSNGGSGGSSNGTGGNPRGCVRYPTIAFYAGGGGGGWGASGGSSQHQSGGAGGKAVALNGHTATFVSCCKARVWGSIS
jgi:hypothetical protein